MYYDYRYRFLLTNVAVAVQVLNALREADLMADTTAHPMNMLGSPMDATGAYCDSDSAVFFGEISGPYDYVGVRSKVPPEQVPDVAAYGFEPVSAEDSAAVLGVWA